MIKKIFLKYIPIYINFLQKIKYIPIYIYFLVHYFCSTNQYIFLDLRYSMSQTVSFSIFE